MAAAVLHRVRVLDAHAHLFEVSLSIPSSRAQQTLSMPVWIPGSYLVREFPRNVHAIMARQNRRTVPVQALNKSSWRVDCVAGVPLTLRYRVLAFDPSVRAAWLDAERGFFNGSSLLMQVHGQEDAPQDLHIEAYADWLLATALQPARVDARGFGHYRATSYGALIDAPVDMGRFWSTSFTARGVPHQLVVSGAPATFDGQRLATDVQRLCEQAMHFWHPDPDLPPPHDRYVFLLHAVDDGYGGLEHRESTALVCRRADLPRRGEVPPDAYRTLLGLFSHEYFHTWNVKRLRPVEFAQLDLSRENHTGLLWFFEGFTSYYDDLLLRRCGLLDDAAYLKRLSKTINAVLQTPGRKVQSLAQASFDAWTKYYRQDENTPNLTISYYAKGSLVALALDLTLRREGHGDLDAVMRALWSRCGDGPMREADVLAALDHIGKRGFEAELQRWVHGTDDLPLAELLQHHGIAVVHEPTTLALRLGIKADERDGVRIQQVLRGGAGEQAGLSPGDEWLGVSQGRTGEVWRIRKLDDLTLVASLHEGADLKLLVSRDRRILQLKLTLPAAAVQWRLEVREPGRAAAWLAGTVPQAAAPRPSPHSQPRRSRSPS